MSELNRAVTDDELHAFVDAQLEPARLPAVLAWLHARPEDAARVMQWQTQRVLLRRLAQSIEPGPTPAALPDVVLKQVRQERQRLQWLQVVSAVVLVVAGIAGGRTWGLAEQVAVEPLMSSSPPFVQDAAAAHAVFVPEKRHPVEVTASDEDHLVQWLSRRLGAPLTVPSLAGFGYRLLGGRLLPGEPGDGTPRAQFMFEDAQGGRVTLYVAVFAPGQAPDASSFRSVRIGDEESFYWVEDRFGYALSAKVSGHDMQALAREVYAQLQHRSPDR
jgi:anti-sigma factor RsiW